MPDAIPEPAIDRAELLELTSRLIRIPTVPSLYPSGEAEAVGVIADLLDDAGVPYRIYEEIPARPNLVIEIGQGNGNAPTLWLNGHLDTVPIGSRDNWTHEPFGGEVVDGRIYGRGASDCKGGAAAMLAAALALHRAGVELRGRLVLSLVAAEEEGQVGLVQLLDRGITADAFISANWSTRVRMATAYRGLCWVEVTTRGLAAHGSRPAAGVNAIEHMIDLVLPALRNDPALADRAPQFSVNLARLDGGDAPNLVADACKAILDYRFQHPDRSEDVLRGIDAVLERLRSTNPPLAVTAVPLYRVEPVWTDPNCSLVRILSSVVEQVAGAKPELYRKTGTGECNLVHHRLGIPVVAYGPGNDTVHAPNEYVAVSDLEAVSRVYVLAAMSFLASGATRPARPPTLRLVEH